MKKILLILLVLFLMSISFGETPIEVDPEIYENEIEKYVSEYNLDASLIQGRMYLYDEWIIYVDSDNYFHKFNTKTKKDILMNNSVDIDENEFYIFNSKIYFRSGYNSENYYSVIEMTLNGDYTCLTEDWTSNLEHNEGKLYFIIENLYEYDIVKGEIKKLSADSVDSSSMLKSGILYYTNEEDSYFRDWNGHVKKLKQYGKSTAITKNKDDFLFIRNNQIHIGNVITNEIKETEIRDGDKFFSYYTAEINLDLPKKNQGVISFYVLSSEKLVYEANGMPYIFDELYYGSYPTNQIDMYSNDNFFVYFNNKIRAICSYDFRTHEKKEYPTDDIVFNVVGVDKDNIYYFDGKNIKYVNFSGDKWGALKANIETEYSFIDGYILSYADSSILIEKGNNHLASIFALSDSTNEELYSESKNKFEYIYSDKDELYFLFEEHCYRYDKQINYLSLISPNFAKGIAVSPKYIVLKNGYEKDNVSILNRFNNDKTYFTIEPYSTEMIIHGGDLYYLSDYNILSKRNLLTLNEEEIYKSAFYIDEIWLQEDILHLFEQNDVHIEINLKNNEIKKRPLVRPETPLFFINNAYIYSYVDSPGSYKYLIDLDDLSIEADIYRGDECYFVTGYFEEALYKAIYAIKALDSFGDVHIEPDVNKSPNKEMLAYYLWAIMKSYSEKEYIDDSNKIIDVERQNSYYDEITNVVKSGVLQLDSKDNFYPEHEVTQKTCVASLIKLINLVRGDDSILVDLNEQAIEFDFIDKNKSLSDNVITYRELYLYLEKAIEILTKDYYKIK